MGMALSPTVIPASGRPTFELPDGQMEIGMGIHGEPGVRRGPIETADEIADELLDAIVADLSLARGDDGGRARQRARGNAQGRALHPLSTGRRPAGRARRDGPAAVDRGVRDVDGDGRRVAVGPAPGRRTVAAALGPGAHAVLRTAMSRVDVLHAVGRALIDARDQLNEADSAAGDGDLGITATTIGEVLLALGPDIDAAEPTAALRRLASRSASKAPSTFGTLVSLGLVGASRSLKDGPDAEATDAEMAARVAAAVEAAITTRGKAGRGGKTLLDALGPAADALQVAAEAGVSLAEAASLRDAGGARRRRRDGGHGTDDGPSGVARRSGPRQGRSGRARHRDRLHGGRPFARRGVDARRLTRATRADPPRPARRRGPPRLARC